MWQAGHKYLLDDKMTECTKGQQGSLASCNQHTCNSSTPRMMAVSAIEIWDSHPWPCSGCLQLHRSGSFKQEFSISLALWFSRKWKWVLSAELPFQYFLFWCLPPAQRELIYFPSGNTSKFITVQFSGKIISTFVCFYPGINNSIWG